MLEYKEFHLMTEITFEKLPQAVTQIFAKLENIERLLVEQSNEQPTENDHWLDLNELCSYLSDKPAKTTVYGWVHSGLIPYHKGQKKLRFLKSEIDAWLKQCRRKTRSEIENEAGEYLKIGRARK